MDHHLYKKKLLGNSDIATLIAVGITPDNERKSLTDWLKTTTIHFGSDGHYEAYIVDDECDIPSHYSLVSEFKAWLKIYDDHECVYRVDAKIIKVFQAGEFGCIMQTLGRIE